MKQLNLTLSKNKLQLSYKEHFSNLVAINQSLNYGAQEDYRNRGRTYVDVPEIVGITGACENVDTLFKIGNHLELPLFLTQTGQLALEQALQSFHGVYTVIHSGRDEEEEDDRHLRQFRLTEEEFDCTFLDMNRDNYDEERMYDALLESIQSTIKAMISRIVIDNEMILKNIYKRDMTKLKTALKKSFLRILYEDAVKLLNDNGFPEIRFGDDLKAEHEAKIVSLLNKNKDELPVFIMKYPKEIKFFNMKVSEKDPRVVLSADLIFPYAGEGTGSAVREHSYEKLNERLLTSTMYKLHIQRGGSYEDFRWYLNIMKNKLTNPHAGYGIGNERVLQYVFTEKDIRNVSVFSLLNKQTMDWDPYRYGKAAVISPQKKHILLSIGKPENKKFLLPYIKKMADNPDNIIYATENTHKFLLEHDLLSSLVYKISQFGETPNILDLLQRRVFDLIINIPTREIVNDSKEFTDGKLIRKASIRLAISLVTDIEVAAMILENLANGKKTITGYEALPHQYNNITI